MGIKSWINITTSKVIINGERLRLEVTGKELLTVLYRRYIKDYPKFFKMDILCRLGLVASDLLLRGTPDSKKEDMSIILFNKSGSLCNDISYQETIKGNNYFPSPSVFVYTLANIVTGEIAIRNKIYGETSFYIMNELNTAQIFEIVNSSYLTCDNAMCICGWLEADSDSSFSAVLFLLDNIDCMDFNEKNINKIINFNSK